MQEKLFGDCANFVNMITRQRIGKLFKKDMKHQRIVRSLTRKFERTKSSVKTLIETCELPKHICQKDHKSMKHFERLES